MEHYCSLQISQLLVRLGFKQKTNVVYAQFNVWKHGEVCKIWHRCTCGIPIHAKKGDFPCPTQVEAIEWLRKYKKVLIGVRISDHWYGRYHAFAEYFENGYDMSFFGNNGSDYKTPFKATEAALKFVISNLLKK